VSSCKQIKKQQCSHSSISPFALLEKQQSEFQDAWSGVAALSKLAKVTEYQCRLSSISFKVQNTELALVEELRMLRKTVRSPYTPSTRSLFYSVIHGNSLLHLLLF